MLVRLARRGICKPRWRWGRGPDGHGVSAMMMAGQALSRRGGRPMGRGIQPHWRLVPMHPPLSSSQSPLSSVSAWRRKLRPLPCSSSPHRAGRGGGPGLVLPKRKRAVDGPKEKNAGRNLAHACKVASIRRSSASVPPCEEPSYRARSTLVVSILRFRGCRSGRNLGEVPDTFPF